MKCAGKGFPVGGNSINRGIEASQGRGQLGQGKQPGRGLYQCFVGHKALSALKVP